MNLELEAEAVKPWLREDLGSVMVLPVQSFRNLEWYESFT